MEEVFKIKTEIFEGPLDLLLSLIEKRKLLINDISLSKVADDFIAHVEAAPELPLGMTANFVLVASTLLLIKSKSLLPNLELTTEEEGSIEDLEKRLRLHKIFKELSRHIEKHFGKKIIFPKSQSRQVTPIFSPSPEITLSNLAQHLQSLIAELPKESSLPETTVKKIISLEDMIERLTRRIQGTLSLNFSDLTERYGSRKGTRKKVTKDERINIIVSFLALLELVKRGVIHAKQEEDSDIEIETAKLATPTY